MNIVQFIKNFTIISLCLFSMIIEMSLVIILPTMLFFYPWIIFGYEFNILDRYNQDYQGLTPFFGSIISSILIFILYKIYDIYCHKNLN